MRDPTHTSHPRRIVWFRGALLLAFVAHGMFTLRAWQDHGYAGFFPPFGATNTTQIFSDLLVSIGLVNVWVFYDIRRRGLSMKWFAAHVAGCVLSGSFAPLCYLWWTSGTWQESAPKERRP